MNNCFPLHFDELKSQTQKELLKYMGVADPADLNWDVFPVAHVFRTSDHVDDVKSEQRYHDLPRGCIWDIDDDDFAYEI